MISHLPCVNIGGQIWPLNGLKLEIRGTTLTARCRGTVATLSPTPTELKAILKHVRTVSGAVHNRGLLA